VVLIIAGTYLSATGLQDSANHLSATAARSADPTSLMQRRRRLAIHAGSCRKPKQGVVLLLHPVRGDRRDMLSRAEFPAQARLRRLMIDFQSHGENRGTGSVRRSRVPGLTGAIQYLHHKLPGEGGCPRVQMVRIASFSPRTDRLWLPWSSSRCIRPSTARSPAGENNIVIARCFHGW